MAYYGYHRISTKEQHLDRGIIEIKRFCENQKIKLESIFTDKITGKNFDRPRYTVLVEDVLRVGDTLIITELDRLNNPVPVSLLSGDRKPQIRFLGNHHSGSGNLYHKSFRM